MLLASGSTGAQPAPEIESGQKLPPVRAEWLGQSEGALRAEFGSSLLSEPIVRRHETLAAIRPSTPGAGDEPADRAPGDQEAASSEAKSPFKDQHRLVQKVRAGDISQVEYELFQDRVYRIRWQLAERFERPLIDPLVAHLTAKLGKPYYDQLIEGKFGSGRATFRRAAWRSGDRNLEIRQLNPLVGGSIFLTLSDVSTVRTIVASGGTAAPEPDSIGRWWTKPIRAPKPMSVAESEALLAAIDEMPIWSDWGSQSAESPG